MDPYPGDDSYTDGEITYDFKIHVIQSEGGRISPETMNVARGETLSFTVEASEGYYIKNVLVDGKLTWLLDEDWLWPKPTTPAKQASLLCEIRKLMPPVVYATSADGVVICMVPCTGYTRTAVNVTAEEMNELWSVKPQQRAAAQGALQYGWLHPLADPRSYNEKGERLQNVYNRKK